MTTTQQMINGLLLPMKGFYILLPQSAVVEITRKPDLVVVENSSEWFKGVFNWRSEEIAVVSLEELCDHRVDTHENSGSRIVILHALDDRTNIDFYALELYGVPHPISLNANSVAYSTDGVEKKEWIASNVLINGQDVIIPNLQWIEYSIQSQLKS